LYSRGDDERLEHRGMRPLFKVELDLLESRHRVVRFLWAIPTELPSRVSKHVVGFRSFVSTTSSVSVASLIVGAVK